MASKAKDWNDVAPAGAGVAASSAGALTCVPWRALEAEIEAWDRLALDPAEPNPFFESWYLLSALRHLPDTKDVLILRFEQKGRLAGLLPIVRNPRYYRWPVPNLAIWLHANCFCGAPLVAKGAEAAFWRALLRWADGHAGIRLFLHLSGLPIDGPMHAALVAVCAQESRRAVLVHEEARALLASDLAPEAYLEAAMSGKKRKELRRQASRLTDEGAVTISRRTDADGIDAWTQTFLTLEQAGWKGRAGSALGSQATTAGLLRDSLAGAAERGRLERLTLALDGKPLAMLATFLTPPGAFSFKTAFDEAYGRFSPGVLLQRENLAMLERPEIAWTDSCASADHPMIDHIWRERRRMGRISVAIGGPLRRALFRQFARAEVARHPPGPTS